MNEIEPQERYASEDLENEIKKLQKEHTNKEEEGYKLKLKELEQLALMHHIDNFNKIVNKCNNSFECVERNINLLIDAMNNFVEQINEKNQEKKKLSKNR